MLKVAFAAFSTLMLATTAVAAEPALHSKVDITTAPKADSLELTFKVLPTDGLHINLDGPWKLEIKSADGLVFEKTTFVKKDLKEDLTGFVVSTKGAPAKKSGELEYSLVSFVCTNDKTACYRDVLTGKAPWSVATK